MKVFKALDADGLGYVNASELQQLVAMERHLESAVSAGEQKFVHYKLLAGAPVLSKWLISSITHLHTQEINSTQLNSHLLDHHDRGLLGFCKSPCNPKTSTTKAPCRVKKGEGACTLVCYIAGLCVDCTSCWLLVSSSASVVYISNCVQRLTTLCIAGTE